MKFLLFICILLSGILRLTAQDIEYSYLDSQLLQLKSDTLLIRLADCHTGMPQDSSIRVWNQIDSLWLQQPIPFPFQRTLGFVVAHDKPNIATYPTYDVRMLNTYPKQRTLFLFYIWILLLSLFASVRILYRKKWITYWTDFKNINIALQNYRDQPAGIYISDILYNIIFIGSISACIEAVFYFGHTLTLAEHLSLYATICAGVGILLLARILLLHVFALVLPFGEQLKFYVYNLNIVNKLSIVLWLIILMVLLSSLVLPSTALIVLMCVLLVAIIFLGWYKGIGIISIKKNDSEFIFILYFCAFEILVILMLAKFLVDFFK